MTDLSIQEGIVPSRWFSVGGKVRCCANAGGRRIRKVLQARRWPQGRSPVSTYADRWARQFDTTPEKVLQHFTVASATRGIPVKAALLVLKILWKRVIFKGRGGSTECPRCGTSFLGEGEKHLFFYCAHARGVWEWALGLMRRGEAWPTDPLADYMVGAGGAVGTAGAPGKSEVALEAMVGVRGVRALA